MNIQLEKIELIKRLADVNNEEVIKQIKAILVPKKEADETARILSNPGMVKKLKESRREIKEGKGVKMDVKGLWK